MTKLIIDLIFWFKSRFNIKLNDCDKFFLAIKKDIKENCSLWRKRPGYMYKHCREVFEECGEILFNKYYPLVIGDAYKLIRPLKVYCVKKESLFDYEYWLPKDSTNPLIILDIKLQYDDKLLINFMYNNKTYESECYEILTCKTFANIKKLNGENK
jgi:hypothetical protein